MCPGSSGMSVYVGQACLTKTQIGFQCTGGLISYILPYSFFETMYGILSNLSLPIFKALLIIIQRLDVTVGNCRCS